MPDSKIMTPLDTSDMTQLAMIEAVRAMSDNMKTMRETIVELRDNAKEDRGVLQQVKEGQIRMEANLMTEEVKDMKLKLAAVEATLAEQRGAFKFGQWLQSAGPMFFAAVGAAVGYFMKAH